MASYKRIFALIFIIALIIAISSAARNKNRIVPEGILYNGNTVVMGTRDPNGKDHIVRMQFVYVRAKLFQKVQYQETFYTPRNEVITQIHVEDVTRHATGSRVELINNGPGCQNATLRFFSKWNSGIDKAVLLYGY